MKNKKELKKIINEIFPIKKYKPNDEVIMEEISINCVVSSWLKPNPINRWWIWFLSGLNGDDLLINLFIITKLASKIGIKKIKKGSIIKLNSMFDASRLLTLLPIIPRFENVNPRK